jgi:hypothetical protein
VGKSVLSLHATYHITCRGALPSVELSEVRPLRSPGTPGMLTPKPVFGGGVVADVFAVALPVP